MALGAVFKDVEAGEIQGEEQMTRIAALAMCVLVLAALPAQAKKLNMVAVPEAQAHCAAEAADGAYCYEWKLVADPALRIVSSGYEDGGSVIVYRRDARGRYRHLAEILPALRDSRYPGQLFWGYSWDIEDIEVVTHGRRIRMMATFDHPELDRMLAGEITTPETRALVLFVGKTTQPEMKLASVRFRELPVDALVSSAP
ncbi:hypothetical protein [Lysobacter brunescens]|uniref:Uncharacterized protein n=1 Tax=Lysobacter brunescens TaxID=262323 RepID=A0ABW2YB51_9GAMM